MKPRKPSYQSWLPGSVDGSRVVAVGPAELVGVLQETAGRVDDVAADHHEVGAGGHRVDDRHRGVLGDVAFAGIPQEQERECIQVGPVIGEVPCAVSVHLIQPGLPTFVAWVTEQFG
jgi:hypothetical protein